MTKPTPKIDRERDTSTFAKGGKGALRKMLPGVPAEPAPPGRTGPSQARAPGSLRARGGPKNIGYGLALPAQPGMTAPAKLGRGR
jgi:hypothetical protein